MMGVKCMWLRDAGRPRRLIECLIWRERKTRRRKVLTLRNGVTDVPGATREGVEGVIRKKLTYDGFGDARWTLCMGMNLVSGPRTGRPSAD